MNATTLTKARNSFAEVIDTVRTTGEPVYMTRHGKPIAAIIDSEKLAMLIEAAEDLADIKAAAAAREEIASEGTIPWDEVKAELGLS